MSKSLVKLFDNSLIPGSLMVLSKFLGVILTLNILNIPFSIKDYTNSFFSFSTVVKAESLTLVNSYSDLIMYLTLAIFLGFNIYKAIYLHNTHLKPDLIIRLAKFNLLSVITGSYEIYHSCFMWLLFVWISNIIIIINLFTERTFIWVGVLTTLVSLILTLLLANDINREIENIKKHPNNYNWN